MAWQGTTNSENLKEKTLNACSNVLVEIKYFLGLRGGWERISWDWEEAEINFEEILPFFWIGPGLVFPPSIIHPVCIYCCALVWTSAQNCHLLQNSFVLPQENTWQHWENIGHIGENILFVCLKDTMQMKRFLLEWVWRTPSDEGKQLIVIEGHQPFWCPPLPSG